MHHKKVSKQLRDVTNISAKNTNQSYKSIIYKDSSQNRSNSDIKLREMEKYKIRLENFYDLMCHLRNTQYFIIPGVSQIMDEFILLHYRLKLFDDTLFLFFHVFCKFTSMKKIKDSKLRLVAVAALLIAIKYEEVSFPDINTIITKFNSDSSISIDEVLETEKFILNTIKFTIDFVNPLFFLQRASRVNNTEEISNMTGRLLLEFMYLEPEFTEFNENIKASTAIYLGRKISKCESNKKIFYSLARADRSEMKNCLELLIKTRYRILSYPGLQSKYRRQSKIDIIAIIFVFLKKLSNKFK